MATLVGRHMAVLARKPHLIPRSHLGASVAMPHLDPLALLDPPLAGKLVADLRTAGGRTPKKRLASRERPVACPVR